MLEAVQPHHALEHRPDPWENGHDRERVGNRAGHEHRGLRDTDDRDRGHLASRMQARVSIARDHDPIEARATFLDHFQRRHGCELILVVALDRARSPRRRDRLDLRLRTRIPAGLPGDVLRHLLGRIRVDDENPHGAPFASRGRGPHPVTSDERHPAAQAIVFEVSRSSASTEASMCSGRRVLFLRVTEPAQALHEQHHGGHAGARHLGGVVQCSAGHPVDDTHVSRTASAKSISCGWNGRGGMRHCGPFDARPPPRRDAPARRHRLGDHRRERLGVEVALVDDDLADRRDRRHDAARRLDRADGRHAAGIERDAPAFEHEARRRCHGVAPHVHRRRPHVRSLAAEAHDVALHAVGPEHGRQGQPEALEHGPLLDVQLEIGGRVRHLAARVARPLEVDAVLGEHRRQLGARGIAQPAEKLRIEVLRHGARAEQAAAEAEPLLVGPVDEPHGRGGRPSAASRRSTSSPASTFRQPSSQPPFETESRWPPIRTARSESPASVAQRLPASSVSTSRAARRASAVPRPGALPGLRPAHPLGSVGVARERAEGLQIVDRPGGSSASPL